MFINVYSEERGSEYISTDYIKRIRNANGPEKLRDTAGERLRGVAITLDDGEEVFLANKTDWELAATLNEGTHT